EVEDARMELDVVADALEDDALEIVVEDLARYAAERLEGEPMAAQERLERRVEHEPRVHRARPRQHEQEAPQGSLGGADLDLAEVAPVDLRLFARQRREAEERFDSRRPHAAHVAAKLRDRALIPTGAEHLVDAGRAQPRVVVEDLADQSLVRVEHRRTDQGPGADEPVGLDGVADGVVMHAELARDRADLPVLGVEQTADARALRRVHHRAASDGASCRRSWNTPIPSSRSRWWGLRRGTYSSLYSGAPTKSAPKSSLSLVAQEPSWSSTTTTARTAVPCHIASASK